MLDELLAVLPNGRDVLRQTPRQLDEILLSSLVTRCDNKNGPLPGPRYFAIEEIENLYPVGLELLFGEQQEVNRLLFESFGRLKAAGYIGPAPGQYGLMTVTTKGRQGLPFAKERTSLLTWAKAAIE